MTDPTPQPSPDLAPAADAGGPPPEPTLPTGGRARPFWWALLATYVVLFFAASYFAFVVEPRQDDLDPRIKQVLAGVQDEDLKHALLEEVDQDAEQRQKTQELAGHAFNVVLGALLGFLSASASLAVSPSGSGAGRREGG